ncbi:MAG: hypothetical protein EB078_00615 [Proteobacteria bacterium]|nr:hypothetical protein [Pseudomonadota bacterium]NDC23170.1 hypothetical protein [Pseudomonadota bacterium]NDD03381.1 hypothetical protein [Pseudomonadota bacterium]NDG25615.1 hypothetical protein [Pseudomonadota bacterium]
MKALLVLSALTLSMMSWSVVEVGEKSPELCWKNVQSKEICLRNVHNKAVVLIYNTGWCPGCQEEISELSKRYDEIKKDDALLISLSAEGFQHGQPANEEFLNQFQKKYQIPFEVASSPNNAGKEFFKPPYYIPATVILDRNGVLQFKKVDASVDEIFSWVKKLSAER